MYFSTLAVLSGLAAVASAHFQLQFPPPRGVFAMNTEPTFCDGYNTAVDNRTTFPINGGFIALNSEHPIWTLGVLLSTSGNPTSFDNFSSAVPFFQVNGEGSFCFPVDFAASGISGLTDGANVTIQLEFDGGDGELFQCADLTLSSSVSLPNDPQCVNATGDSVQTLAQSGTSAPAPSKTGSSSSSAPSATKTNAASVKSAMEATGLMALVGAVLALL